MQHVDVFTRMLGRIRSLRKSILGVKRSPRAHTSNPGTRGRSTFTTKRAFAMVQSASLTYSSVWSRCAPVTSKKKRLTSSIARFDASVRCGLSKTFSRIPWSLKRSHMVRVAAPRQGDCTSRKVEAC